MYKRQTYANTSYASQHPWDHVEGAPFGTRGGLVVRHVFPADGEYVFEVNMTGGNNSRFEDIDISINGERAALVKYETQQAESADGRGGVPMLTDPIMVKAGQHTVAAKINGEPAALRTELKSGDVVEIITAPGARPNPAWLSMVRSGRARSKIRHYLKNMETDESRSLGEKMLAQALRAEGLQLPTSDPSDADAQALWQQLTKWSGNRNRGELLVDIGLGRKIAIIVAKRMAQLLAERGTLPDAVTLTLGLGIASLHAQSLSLIHI